MKVDRLFVGIGLFYLIVGVWLGARMGRTEDFSLMPIHAHIMMLGFVVMVLSGIIYKLWPEMQTSRLAVAHFALHQFGTLVMLVCWSMYLISVLPDAVRPIVFPLSEGAIFLGVILLAWNFWKTTSKGTS